MKVQHNLAAENTQRQKSNRSTKLSKSIGWLSSGSKINSAADDAAGVSISEKMRGQIRGMDRAALNVQDGLSLIQTADGALQDIHDILQRMRELAVQSSSDTNSDDIDRLALDGEYQQMKSEINDIANNTLFNTRRLLDGTLTAHDEQYVITTITGYTKTQVMTKAKVPDSTLTPAESAAHGSPNYMLSQTFKDEAINGTSTINFTNNGDDTLTLSFNIPNKTFTPADNSKVTIAIPGDVSGGSFEAKVTADDGTEYSISVGCDKINYTADDIDFHFNSVTVNNSTTKTPIYQHEDAVRRVSMIIQTGANYGDDLEISIDRMGADSIGGYYGYIDKIMIDPGKPPTYKTITTEAPVYKKNDPVTLGTSTSYYGASQSAPGLTTETIYGYKADGTYYSTTVPPGGTSSTSYARTYDPITYGADVGVEYVRNYTNAAHTIPAITSGSWTGPNGVFPLYDAKPTITNTEFGQQVTGANEKYTSGYPKTYTWGNAPAQTVPESYGTVTYKVTTYNQNYTITKDDGSTEVVPVTRYQLTETFSTGGSNTYGFDSLQEPAKQQTIMTDPGYPPVYQDVNSMMYVHVQDTDIARHNSALISIDVCSGAINDISNQRSELGAIQNRLQFRYNDLGVNSENQSASYSVIRDADMAKEMAELNKHQIMDQAATAMLAQANSLPQAVLQLIGG